MTTLKQIEEEFEKWCMENPATDGITLAVKLASSPNYWIPKFKELLKECVVDKEDNSEFRNDPLHPVNGFKLGWNAAISEMNSRIEEIIK